MTLIDALMAISVLSTGLFTGLLMTVVVYFQKALSGLSGSQFALVMQRFLAITRTHPLNYAMTLISGFVPIAPLIMLREHPRSGAFVFTIVGLLAFWGGPILTSRYFAEPLYDGDLCIYSGAWTSEPQVGRADSQRLRQNQHPARDGAARTL